MNTTNVTVITTVEEKTEHAAYIFEYTTSNGNLIRAQAHIMELSNTKSGPQKTIGTIYLEQDIVTCSLPKENDLAPYFIDFDNLVKQIQNNNSTNN